MAEAKAAVEVVGRQAETTRAEAAAAKAVARPTLPVVERMISQAANEREERRTRGTEVEERMLEMSGRC